MNPGGSARRVSDGGRHAAGVPAGGGPAQRGVEAAGDVAGRTAPQPATRLALRTGWAALLLVVGATQLASAWVGVLPVFVFAVAAVAPVGLVTLARWLRLPVGLTAVTLVALALLGAYAATASTGAGPVRALRDAVPRLLTAPRPAPSTPDLLVSGALLAVLVGLWTAVRVSRPGRVLLAPPVGAAILYGAAALLTAGGSDPHGFAASGLLLLVLAGWLLLDRYPAGNADHSNEGTTAPPMADLGIRGPTGTTGSTGTAGSTDQPGRGGREGRQGRRRRRGRTGQARAAVATMACCLGVALLAALPALGPAFEPRDLVSPPSVRLAEANPLSRLAAWAQQGDVELMRVRGQARSLRLVTLTDYTGANWQANGSYRPLGTVQHAALPPGGRQVSGRVEVRITALDGPWLPVVGTPTDVSLRGAAVEPDSGSTTAPGGVRDGMSYTVRGTFDLVGPGDIVTAEVPATELVERYLQVPRLPSNLADYALQITRGARTPFERAVAIEFAVRSGRRFDAGVPSGSSYARLNAFLFGPSGEPGAQAGTSEQFATAFAVLGRAVGLPTRVVVGFRPGQRIDPVTSVVRGRNAMAWPEVYFAGAGWQPFEPTPLAGDADPVSAVKQQVLDRLTGPLPAESAPPSPDPPRRRAPTATRADGSDGGWLSSWSARQAAALGVAVLLLPLVLLALARQVRRIRHRTHGVRGAWSEVLDLLTQCGAPAPRWQSAPDAAAVLAVRAPVTRRSHGGSCAAAGQPQAAPAGRWLGPGTVSGVDGSTVEPHPAVRIAEVADRVAFGPEREAFDAGPVWADLRVLRRSVRRAAPWYKRLCWPFDPRPLLRRTR